MILSFILLIGAVTLDPDDHVALKIFLFLLSMIPFFISLHFGALAIGKYYNFTPLEDAMGNITYWLSLMFGVIVTYFLIYLTYKLIHNAAQQKKERLQY